MQLPQALCQFRTKLAPSTRNQNFLLSHIPLTLAKLKKFLIKLPLVRTSLVISINFGAMTFEEYLISKKIDGKTFQEAEPKVYKDWEYEFDQMHPNSFTLQKLNLINPIRRKYILKQEPVK